MNKQTKQQTQLKYKANARSVVFEEVNEKYTTQSCSCCGCISNNSPKGRAGLEIREWNCAECGARLDRNIKPQEHSRAGASASCRRNPRSLGRGDVNSPRRT